MNLRSLVLIALASQAAGAQVVRGTVTERSSGAPVSGVVLSLVLADSRDGSVTPVANALSNEQGEYAMRAPRPGRYVVHAKRIGVLRSESEPLDLAAGETRAFDLALDAVLYSLPEVRVAGGGLCTTRADQGGRVASIWDEVRTALTATQISLRDRLFQAHLSRYVRELHPRTLRVLSESRGELKGTMDRPFVSLSGDSLSRVGFWYTDRQGYNVYHAPDADVLLSAAFQRDHCFSVVEGGRDRRGLVGLAFEPLPDRRVGEVRGTLWIEDRTFHLRFLEYRYTRHEATDVPDRVGGEIHFARLPTGAWIVRRWFIRMPLMGRATAPPVGIEGRLPSVIVRPTVYRLVEEGGEVFAEGLRLFERPATLTGAVTDSAGRPLAGATVRLSGTPYITTADETGRFLLDSLPGGRFPVVAEHPGYAALGAPAAEDVVELTEGATRQVRLRADATAALVERVCEGQPHQRRRAVLRITLADSATSAPVPRATLGLRWVTWAGATARTLSPQGQAVEGTTDSRGTVAFCDLPANVSLELTLRHGSQGVELDVFRLREDELSARTVRVSRR